MIIPHRGIWPKIHETAFVAPSADVIGDVEIGDASSVWFQCVLRGDLEPIRVGSRTNIQDHAVIHTSRGKAACVIGDEVTIGHRATLHGCRIGNRALIGMGAIVLDGAEVGEESLVGAGALVTKGARIPPRSLVVGAPARVKRPLTEEEIASLAQSAEHYVGDRRGYGFIGAPARLGADDRDLEDLEGTEAALEEDRES